MPETIYGLLKMREIFEMEYRLRRLDGNIGEYLTGGFLTLTPRAILKGYIQIHYSHHSISPDCAEKEMKKIDKFKNESGH